MKTIKELCEEYGVTQAELSRAFSIPIRTVHDWHAGKRVPPDYVVTLIEESLKTKKERLKMKYVVRDREAGNVIETFETEAEALYAVEKFEEEDKKDGTYTEDFYEVVATENA